MFAPRLPICLLVLPQIVRTDSFVDEQVIAKSVAKNNQLHEFSRQCSHAGWKAPTSVLQEEMRKARPAKRRDGLLCKRI